MGNTDFAAEKTTMTDQESLCARDEAQPVPGYIVSHIRPPAIAGTYLAIAAGLHFLVPGLHLISSPLRLLGAGVALAATATMLWAVSCCEKRDTTHDTQGEPTELVADGPFAFSRNPMYLSMTGLLLGIAVLVGTAPFFLAAVAFWFTMALVFVPAEERQLTAKFGTSWSEYCSRVRRWL